ncbi:MAG TPA: putative maltokinase [Polyangia bacterium]|nr:putative maltokinase [Polyangia bacterium]
MLRKLQPIGLAENPLWYKDAIIYELHVRAFADSNGDGIGDLLGLVGKLDYLQDLGVTAIWLLPFYPSPLRDGGYDIADYTSINPAYGTLRDFKLLLREAHRRGVRVITELVLNHTSNEHAWFQRARRAPPHSRWRNFYVWSDTPDRYNDARIIFKDFETSNWSWDPVAKAYYWHRFYSHQPDLNYDNPEVHRTMFKVVDFWLDLGVDGLRLDAVPYLYEREGTRCENLSETHEFLRKLRTHVDAKYRDRMLLAEANQWPEDAAAYFGEGAPAQPPADPALELRADPGPGPVTDHGPEPGTDPSTGPSADPGTGPSTPLGTHPGTDPGAKPAADVPRGPECHMNFHFPLMPRMFMAVHLEDRFPIVDILKQTPPIPADCQWATFLRNHDELTLEMVTDEDRDYMYQVYAEDPYARINLGIRRRLAPLLRVRRRIELMNALLFSLPGTPVLYYGDEIGMGDNIYLGDRDGVRTPMQWSADRNAGFSTANPQKLYLPIITDPEYHYEAYNVQAQQSNPTSLLWWMKRLIALRKQYPVFGSGHLEFVHADNHRVLAFLRTLGEERVLVVANLSRFPQCAELDLSGYQGMVPVEMFGRARFPAVGRRPYFLSFGPHAFYWFLLEPPKAGLGTDPASLPLLEAKGVWYDVLRESDRRRLARVLLGYMTARRWFRGKARTVKDATVSDVLRLGAGDDPHFLVLVTIEYMEGDPDTYVLVLAFRAGEAGQAIERRSRHAVIAHLHVTGARGGRSDGVLYDSLATGEAAATLLEGMRRKSVLAGEVGQLQTLTGRGFKELVGPATPPPRASEFEQTNTTVVLGDRLLLKVFREVEAGPNPEWEIGTFLNERARHGLVPRMVGALQYHGAQKARSLPAILGTVQEFVPNEGVAWQFTIASLDRYCERVLAAATGDGAGEHPQPPHGSLLEKTRQEVPQAMHDLLGLYLPLVRLLGQRTAELHLALAESKDNLGFVPEPFTELYQKSLYQRARTLLMRTSEMLGRGQETLPETARPLGREMLERVPEIDARLRAVAGRKIEVMRIRCHGDLHLGQILYTGSDFVLIDFEGEPARPLNERRYKRCPLRDVTGMLRSFHYAGESVLRSGRQRPEDIDRLRPWIDAWTAWVGAAYLGAYLQAVPGASFVPASEADIELLLEFYLLEKCIYEVGYELNNRPDWLVIPLQGLHDLLERRRGRTG